MRSTNRRRARATLSALPLVACLSLSAASAASARGAELFVDAPEACVDPATLADEVGDLIGKPLTDVADVDFRVQITEAPRRRWRLRLMTIQQRASAGGETPAVRGTREIEGATCAELAEAASVAIAVSIRSIAGETAAAAATPSAAAAPTLSPPTPASTTPSIVRAGQPAAAWHPAVVLALATDTGALPNTGLGLDLEVGLQRGSLQVVAFGTWFGSQDTVGAANAGGTFQLALGGALACFAPQRGRWTGLACGGVELGRLAGTGLGVARPETAATFWRAGRADVGVRAALGGNAALVLRVGVAAPWSRPDFVLDGADPVYRPSRLAGRLTAGLEIGF
ncbi:MAG TPA: hypothetical protein VLC06_24335 [Polyangia bacterium]|nr:hypothetical protein [Polyangia bacterium]